MSVLWYFRAGEETAWIFVSSPSVRGVRCDDEMAFGAGEGDVEEPFFLFELVVAFGVVAGEFVIRHSGDDDGVEFEAFGLVDGEDGDGHEQTYSPARYCCSFLVVGE